MDLEIEIALDSDAFAPSNGGEIARLLRAFADRIEYNNLYAGYMCALYDVNGVFVGWATVMDAEDKKEE